MPKTEKNNCFLCLNYSRNKVCTKCECYAHPACWGRYLKTTSVVISCVTNDGCSLMSPWSTDCPLCKRPITATKALTRSDTFYTRKKGLLIYATNMLIQVNQTEDMVGKLAIAKVFYDLIVDHRWIVGDANINGLVKESLRTFHTNEKWKEANLYHLRIFGNQI